MEDNLHELVTTMAESEKADIFGPHDPETDMDDHFYTSIGITLFQMVDENVSVCVCVCVVCVCVSSGITDILFLCVYCSSPPCHR